MFNGTKGYDVLITECTNNLRDLLRPFKMRKTFADVMAANFLQPKKYSIKYFESIKENSTLNKISIGKIK